MSQSCPASVGGISCQGLIGGGREHSPNDDDREARIVALALTLPEPRHDASTYSAMPIHSACDGLPDFAEHVWADFIGAPPERSPNILMLAAAPQDGVFAIEQWLSRLDTTLPWARKVGGETSHQCPNPTRA